MYALIEVVGIIAGLFTTFSSIPQAVKVMKIQDASGLSLASLVVVDVGSLLWFVYAIGTKDNVLVGWQIISIVLNTLMIALKVKYDKQQVYCKLPNNTHLFDSHAVVIPNSCSANTNAFSTSFQRLPYTDTQSTLVSRTSSMQILQEHAV